MRALFRDRFVGAVRAGHPLSVGALTPARYAACRHVSVSRRGCERGPIVANVPKRHTARLRDGMHTFDLPVATPVLAVSMLWHPRMEADPAHRWLRRRVYDVCAGGADDQRA